jgi:hypothetical protein
MRRQHVDDVGPVVAMSVAIPEQLRADRVTVGLVVGENAAEGIAGEWLELREGDAEVGVLVGHRAAVLDHAVCCSHQA